MNIFTSSIRSYLEAVRKVRRSSGKLPGGFVYLGYEDFLLQHGQTYYPMTYPSTMFRGAPRACFGNAIAIAVIYGLPYVEGYAINECGFPIHHAWNADADGNVFDSTWLKYPGVSYFGVEFSAERADDATWNGDASVLDDWMRGWPLLKSPWNGEDYSLSWPPSPRLEELKTQKAGVIHAARQRQI